MTKLKQISPFRGSGGFALGGLALGGFLLLSLTANAQVPLVYDVENTGADCPKIEMAPIEELPWQYHLPDALTLANGEPVNDLDDWRQRRSEIIQQLYHYEIGAKPTTPRDSIDAWMDADTLCVNIHNNGNTLLIKAPIHYPEGADTTRPYPAIIGVGMPTGSLPPEIFSRRGIATITYPFMEVMSHTQVRGTEPINAIYPDQTEIGAYSAWSWGVSRIIDALEMLGEASGIDTRHIGITGCSFAGKMALFSGALDERIALTIAQEPGGGGAAAWRVSEGLGNVETLARTNYSWFKESMRQFGELNVNRLPLDHHELVALVAPRPLLVLGNTDYEWLADESGYVSCRVARQVWEHFGVAQRMGYSIEGGHPHCMLPQSQWPEVEAFVDRYLLGKDVDTTVMRAPMFEDTDWQKWISVAGYE